jgi:hypothetical protein
MNAPRLALAGLLALAALVAATPTAAHGYHYGGGFRGNWYGPGVSLYYGGPLWWGGAGYFGSPYWGSYAYATPPAYVFGPPGVVSSTAGVVYIEREPGAVATRQPPPAPAAAPEAAPAPAGQWWYLCASPRGAYPYVRECPGGWERVPAIPPGTIR